MVSSSALNFKNKHTDVMASKLARAVSSIDTFFFDCDGVLWNSYGAIPGAIKLIEKLRELKKRVFFITNNSVASQEQNAKKFEKNGFQVFHDEILGTAYLGAMYIKNNPVLREKKVYMIGSEGMAKEFDKAGINYIGYGPQLPRNDPTKHYALNYDVSKDPDVGAVIVGFDKDFNINKISQAMQYLQDENIPFIATNLDNKYPVGGNVFTPGTGVCVKAIEHASSRQPIVLGKPSKMMFEIAQSMYDDIVPERTLMTGDRLDTDIKFGKNCGLQTLCVLSGIVSKEHIDKVSGSGDTTVLPDYVADSVQELYDALNEQ